MILLVKEISTKGSGLKGEEIAAVIQVESTDLRATVAAVDPQISGCFGRSPSEAFYIVGATVGAAGRLGLV